MTEEGDAYSKCSSMIELRALAVTSSTEFREAMRLVAVALRGYWAFRSPGYPPLTRERHSPLRFNPDNHGR